MDQLTPREIVKGLDAYIIGQEDAKKAVAVAFRNRQRRAKLTPEMRREVMPKNILMVGPTGIGKTEIARRVAQMTEAPFIKVEATKFTEVGYVGRDAESVIYELVDTAVNQAYDQKAQDVESKAEKLAGEKIINYLCQQWDKVVLARKRRSRKMVGLSGATAPAAGEPGAAKASETRKQVAQLYKSRQLEDRYIEIDVASPPVDAGPPSVAPGSAGMDGYGYSDYEEPGTPATRRRRKVLVKEARRILTREETNKLIDFDTVIDTAIEQVESGGIVFIDELDKLAGPRIEVGRDISGEGVQRDLIPIVEGTSVLTRYGPVKTDHILFIAAGTFYQSKPADLLPELQGRFPLRVELKALTRADLKRILLEPKNALTKQYKALLETEGVNLEFTDDAIDEIAGLAAEMNEEQANVGARRLATIMEKLLEDLSFNAADHHGETVTVDAAYVREHVADILKKEAIARYIL